VAHELILTAYQSFILIKQTLQHTDQEEIISPRRCSGYGNKTVLPRCIEMISRRPYSNRFIASWLTAWLLQRRPMPNAS